MEYSNWNSLLHSVFLSYASILINLLIWALRFDVLGKITLGASAVGVGSWQRTDTCHGTCHSTCHSQARMINLSLFLLATCLPRGRPEFGGVNAGDIRYTILISG
jgi:hypothetical protein